MAIQLVSHMSLAETFLGGGTYGIPATPMDTTGANLIVVCKSFATNNSSNGWNIGDNKGNTYTTIVSQHSSSYYGTLIAYCLNPNVGTGHTFNGSGNYPDYEAWQISTWSGVKTSAAVDQNDLGYRTSLVTSVSGGTINPTYGKELLISNVAIDSFSTSPTLSGLTVLDTVAGTAGNVTGAMAYEIQTIGTSRSISWSWSTFSSVASSCSVSFYAAPENLTKSLSDSSSYGSSRVVSVSKVAGLIRGITVNIMNGASRLTLLGKNNYRTLSDSMMNAVVRLTTLFSAATFHTNWNLIVKTVTSWTAKNRGQ